MLSRQEAPTTTARAFACSSRREWRSTKVRAVDQAGVLVDVISRTTAFGHDCQIAGRHRVREQQIERAGELPVAERAAYFGDGHAERLAGCGDALGSLLNRAIGLRRSCHRGVEPGLLFGRDAENRLDAS